MKAVADRIAMAEQCTAVGHQLASTSKIISSDIFSMAVDWWNMWQHLIKEIKATLLLLHGAADKSICM